MKRISIFVPKSSSINCINMKKSLLFAFVMLALSLSASAQYRGFTFGMKMGPAFDWAGSKNNTIHNEGTRLGFRWGLVADYYFSENYALVTGLNVNYLRGHYSYEDKMPFALDSVTNYFAMGNVDRLYKATTFEIPVALKMVTEEFGPFSFFAQVGASVGYTRKALAKDVFEGTGEDAAYQHSDEDYVSAKAQYNPFHLGLNVSVGAQFVIKGSTRAFADLYYSRDLLNGIEMIKYSRYYAGQKSDDMRRTDNLDYRQNIFGIEVGILF